MIRRTLTMVLIAPLLMAPLCPSNPRGNGDEEDAPAAGDLGDLGEMGAPRPILVEPYTGNLGCRLMMTPWLDAGFPIAMTACGNYSVVLPFLVWDSVPARRGDDGAFGRGYR